MNSRKNERLWVFWVPFSLAILIYCAADVLLKWGNIEINSTLNNLFQGEFWFIFLFNFSIIFAFVLALISKLIMGYILSKNPLGLSEGLFLGFSAMILFLLGIVFFNEAFTFQRAIAICTITVGIFLLYSRRSSTNSSKELFV